MHMREVATDDDVNDASVWGTISSAPHKKIMMEITRETMMQRLGAPPVWKAHRNNAKENCLGYEEDPEQAVTPFTYDRKQGMGVKATMATAILDSDSDSQTESESSRSRNTDFSLGTAPEGSPFYAQKGILPASLSKLTKAPSEQESSINDSNGARSVQLRLPTRLITKLKRVKEVGDLHRLHDYCQVRNRHQERTEKHHDEPPVKYIQFPSQHCAYEPFLEAIKIPSQFSGHRSFKSQMKEESKGVLPGKHKKRLQQRASLSFTGSSLTPPKRKLLRATKSFDEHDFMDNLGRRRVSHKSSSKDNDKSGTSPAEPPTPQKWKGALPPRSVHTQSFKVQAAKPKKVKYVSQGSQQKQPQLGSEIAGVHSAFGFRPKLDARTMPNQKATVVYITRAR
jgi:hypothetical protein